MRTRVLCAAATLVFTLVPVIAPADPPTEIPFRVQFADVNPCDPPNTHILTMSGTIHLHDHDGMTVLRMHRTITTDPSGFVGVGTNGEVANGRVYVFSLNDHMSNEAGQRIRAHTQLVVDLSSGAARVDDYLVTCLGGP